MKKVNTKDVAEDTWTYPKGTFAGFGKNVSIALGTGTVRDEDGKTPVEADMERAI
jgi:hypothetical protein